MEFFWLILLVVVGLIGYKVYRANFGGDGSGNSLGDRRSGQQAISNEPRIENMRPGGVFSLRGVGQDMDDFDVSVVGRHVYDEDGFQWLEIEGDAGTQQLWVTVEDDDEVEADLDDQGETVAHGAALRRYRCRQRPLTPESSQIGGFAPNRSDRPRGQI